MNISENKKNKIKTRKKRKISSAKKIPKAKIFPSSANGVIVEMTSK